MKATGIVRKIDNLGRIVIPKELRKTLDLDPKESLEIYVERDNIIFSKYENGCIFCDEMNNTFEYEGKIICKSCLEDMEENIGK
ncbi:MAG: AbrB/MazE/SpoVT family DNA-binding domain-containing protein [Halanaerobiales bacterium]